MRVEILLPLDNMRLETSIPQIHPPQVKIESTRPRTSIARRIESHGMWLVVWPVRHIMAFAIQHFYVGSVADDCEIVRGRPENRPYFRVRFFKVYQFTVFHCPQGP